MSFIEKKVEAFEEEFPEIIDLPENGMTMYLSKSDADALKSFLRTALTQQKQEFLERVEEKKIKHPTSGMEVGYNRALSEVRQLLETLKK